MQLQSLHNGNTDYYIAKNGQYEATMGLRKRHDSGSLTAFVHLTYGDQLYVSCGHGGSRELRGDQYRFSMFSAFLLRSQLIPE